eukprot:s156_g12.t1
MVVKKAAAPGRPAAKSRPASPTADGGGQGKRKKRDKGGAEKAPTPEKRSGEEKKEKASTTKAVTPGQEDEYTYSSDYTYTDRAASTEEKEDRRCNDKPPVPDGTLIAESPGNTAEPAPATELAAQDKAAPATAIAAQDGAAPATARAAQAGSVSKEAGSVSKEVLKVKKEKKDKKEKSKTTKGKKKKKVEKHKKESEVAAPSPSRRQQHQDDDSQEERRQRSPTPPPERSPTPRRPDKRAASDIESEDSLEEWAEKTKFKRGRPRSYYASSARRPPPRSRGGDDNEEPPPRNERQQTMAEGQALEPTRPLAEHSLSVLRAHLERNRERHWQCQRAPIAHHVILQVLIRTGTRQGHRALRVVRTAAGGKGLVGQRATLLALQRLAAGEVAVAMEVVLG